MSIFSERIRGLREDSDLTQTEMAKILGTNQRKISRMETGENEPNIHDIEVYCKYFDISSDYVIGLIDRPEKLSAKE